MKMRHETLIEWTAPRQTLRDALQYCGKRAKGDLSLRKALLLLALVAACCTWLYCIPTRGHTGILPSISFFAALASLVAGIQLLYMPLLRVLERLFGPDRFALVVEGVGHFGGGGRLNVVDWSLISGFSIVRQQPLGKPLVLLLHLDIEMASSHSFQLMMSGLDRWPIPQAQAVLLVLPMPEGELCNDLMAEMTNRLPPIDLDPAKPTFQHVIPKQVILLWAGVLAVTSLLAGLFLSPYLLPGLFTKEMVPTLVLLLLLSFFAGPGTWLTLISRLLLRRQKQPVHYTSSFMVLAATCSSCRWHSG